MKIVEDLIDGLNSCDEALKVCVISDGEYIYDYDVYEFEHPQLGWMVGIDLNNEPHDE
tara:strand:+ start:56 stop:229 length:174 start_codon:yes stop_codon:yes gene_type:complete